MTKAEGKIWALVGAKLAEDKEFGEEQDEASRAAAAAAAASTAAAQRMAVSLYN